MDKVLMFDHKLRGGAVIRNQTLFDKKYTGDINDLDMLRLQIEEFLDDNKSNAWIHVIAKIKPRHIDDYMFKVNRDLTLELMDYDFGDE